MLVSLVIAGVLPAIVAAHAELVSSTPAAGSVVEAPLAAVVLTFDEAVVGNSSFSVVDTSGAVVATGGPDPAQPTVMRASLPPLAGAFEVKWTSVAEDGDIEHGTFTFTVVAPTPPPASATPITSASPTVSAEASSAPSPTASPGPADAGNGSDTDVLVPIAVVGILVGVGLGWFLRRRGAA